MLHAAERLHRVIVPTTSSWDRTGRKGSMVRLYKAIECIHNRFISLFGWDFQESISLNMFFHFFQFHYSIALWLYLLIACRFMGVLVYRLFVQSVFDMDMMSSIRVITNSKCHTSSLRKETVDIRMCLTGWLFHWRNDCIWCFIFGWICNFVVNVFWLGCDLPKGASQRPWSKQLRVKFKLNSIEWMTPCDLVPQFLTALD